MVNMKKQLILDQKCSNSNMKVEELESDMNLRSGKIQLMLNYTDKIASFENGD